MRRDLLDDGIYSKRRIKYHSTSKDDATFCPFSCQLLTELSQSLQKGVSVDTGWIYLGGEHGDLDLEVSNLSSLVHSCHVRTRDYIINSAFSDLSELNQLAYLRKCHVPGYTPAGITFYVRYRT